MPGRYDPLHGCEGGNEMTPKEKYEARRAAKRAGYEVREKNNGRTDIDGEELIFDISNSLDRIATSLEVLVNREVSQ